MLAQAYRLKEGQDPMPYCSWDQVRRQVRNVRAAIQAQAAPSSLITIRDYHFDNARNRLFFLSNEISKTSSTIGQLRLYAVDLTNLNHDIIGIGSALALWPMRNNVGLKTAFEL